MNKSSLLREVVNWYLNSRDFNGYHLPRPSEATRTSAVALVKEGLLEVVSEEDYPNPFIRPWKSRRTLEQQINELVRLDAVSWGVCLYPTGLALTKEPSHTEYPQEQYRSAMAKGSGTLELCFFSMDVLEGFRNDPQYDFEFGDFGVQISTADGSDPQLDDPNSFGLTRVGYGYDTDALLGEGSEVVRRACAFVGDLAKLPARQQQRWQSYEVESTGFQPHPMWFSMQMGHWPDGIGPHNKFMGELLALNELHKNAFGIDLFRSTDRPREFGWVLRGSQREWDDFIHLCDKLLSENIRDDALDALDVPRETESGDRIGTLRRLELALVAHKVPEDVARQVLAPLREVRAARQKPAHALRMNVSDVSVVQKQADLLSSLWVCLEHLRVFWSRHPKNADWKEPEHLGATATVYRL